MVEVVYFPERQGNYGELWGVGPKALEVLQTLCLPDGGMARGMALRCDVNDGLMHIRAVYTLRLIPMVERGLMGDMRHRMMGI